MLSVKLLLYLGDSLHELVHEAVLEVRGQCVPMYVIEERPHFIGG